MEATAKRIVIDRLSLWEAPDTSLVSALIWRPTRVMRPVNATICERTRP